jgi:uncharacterized membrane protein
MATYIIIGGDEKEYGPVTAGDVRQWIAEGRLSEQSLMKAESDAEYRPLAKFPEFADAFAAEGASPNIPPPPATSTGWAERDYDLDIGDCVSRGWELFKNNFGILFVSALVVMLIEGAIGGLGSIPYIGMIFSIANLVIAGPLMGGLYYVFLRTIRGEPADAGDVFAGFRKAFAQLFLGHLVPALLAGLCLIPFAIVLAVTILPLATHGQFSQLSNQQALHALAGQLSPAWVLILIASLFVCMLPMLYLQTCWAFTLPLIIDKEMDFWTAMKASRTMVKKHWWHVFGLIFLIGLLNLLGVLLCCIGLLFTVPIGYATLMFAYETIFAERQAA